MTAPGVQVQAGAVLEALEAVSARATDLRPVWQGTASQALRDMVVQTFATEGAFIGERWAQLRPTTVRLKERAGRAGLGILRLFDVLYRSLTVRSHPDQVAVVEPQAFTFGTSVPHARFAQDGWVASTVFGRARTNGPITVQPRPVLPREGLPESVRGTIEQAMARYVSEGRA